MDRKYGKITTEYKDIPADEPVFLFRAKDALAPFAIECYLRMCEEIALHGAKPEIGEDDRVVYRHHITSGHINLVNDQLNYIKEWQKRNPQKVRVPD